MSEGTPVANETEVLAWVVLRAADRTQTKGSTVRLVFLGAPEVAHEVGMELTEAQLLRVEGYLACHGYIERVDIDLSSGTYTITPGGFDWLEGGMPKLSSSERVRELANRPGEEAAFESALRTELEEERRRMEEIERELLDEVGQNEEPSGAPKTAAGAPQGVDTEERHQGWIPRRLQRGLNEARSNQLRDERPWWRRRFGG